MLDHAQQLCFSPLGLDALINVNQKKIVALLSLYFGSLIVHKHIIGSYIICHGPMSCMFNILGLIQTDKDLGATLSSLCNHYGSWHGYPYYIMQLSSHLDMIKINLI